MRAALPLSFALSLSLFAGCARTEVLLGVVTDLHAPKALDAVQLQISRDGVPLKLERDLWPIPGIIGGEYVLPASFGLWSPDGSPVHVEVALNGLKDNEVMVTRRAGLKMVPGKTLFLRLGLVAACVHKDDCLDGQTCAEGLCVDEEVDARTLPEYRAELVTQLTCDSGTQFLDTSTDQPLPMADGASDCAGPCHEGTCYVVPPGEDAGAEPRADLGAPDLQPPVDTPDLGQPPDLAPAGPPLPAWHASTSGLPSERVTLVALDPQPKAAPELYLIQAQGDLPATFSSTGGAPFTAFNPTVNGQPLAGRVVAIAAVQQTVYYLTNSAFAIRDASGSWFTPDPNTSGLPLDDLFWYGVWVHPALPQVAWVSSSAGLYRTGDAGVTWTRVDSFATPTGFVVATAPSDSSRVYFGFNDTLFVSNDGGATFTSASGIVPVSAGWNIKSLAVNPADANDLILSVEDSASGQLGLYRNQSGGTGETNRLSVPAELDNELVTTIAFDPGSPQVVYLGTDQYGLYVSTNGGSSFNQVAGGPPQVSSIAVDASGVVYVAAQGGLWTGPRGAATLSLLNSGELPPPYVSQVEVDRVTGAVVAVTGLNTAALWRSVDRGLTWTSANAGLGTNTMTYPSFPLVPASDGLYLGHLVVESSDVSLSANGGASWSTLASLSVGQLTALAVASPDTWYLGTSDDLVVAQDNGTILDYADAGLSSPVNQIAVDPTDSNIAWAAAGSLYLTSDGFKTVVAVDIGAVDEQVYTVALDPENHKLVYAGADTGVYRSDPSGGPTWTRLDGYRLAVPGPGGVVYFAHWQGGVWRSLDHGATLEEFNSGPSAGATINSLAIDPADPYRVYAATAARGVLVSK